MTGEEDCLYLSVFVPREHPDPEEKLDVMVHIHEGFPINASNYTHPSFLMDREIILVTFNYRLGIFGFLSTEDDNLPGNYGLKDQVLALEWVQSNIACFGGNPDSVTLTGSASVHLHYLSPMSRGLFHRGISHNGVALSCWSLQKQPLKKAQLLAQAVGCPCRCSKAIANCLKQRHYKNLESKMHLFFGYDFKPFRVFGPVVEKGVNPFITKQPYVLLKRGKFHDLPWIVSTGSSEGMFLEYFNNCQILKEIDQKWEDTARFLLDYNYTLPEHQRQNTAAKIKEFYFDGGEINICTFPQLAQLFNDRFFRVDAEIAAKLQARFSQSPIYYYHFGYSSKHAAPPGNKTQVDQVGCKRENVTEDGEKIEDIMLEMITSFAQTGFPKMEGIYWEPTGDQQLTYLNISSNNREDIRLTTANKTLFPLDFWTSLGLLEGENLLCLIKDEL